MGPTVLTDAELVDAYARLCTIRALELTIESLYHLDEMKTPVHLSLGQEAVAVGVCCHLRSDDHIFSNHRSHAHYVAKGGDITALVAELYSRETGCAHGRGGSMHVIDTRVGHMGSSAIVAGGVPHAVGAAFASVMQKRDTVAVTFFGDAACEQGVLYESMNWAAYKKIPVIFVCENNSYAVCSHLSARQCNSSLYKRAHAFDIPSQQINGMDFFAVAASAQDAIAYARAGKGPFFLEYTVERWRGHAGPGDPHRLKYRTPQERETLETVDPLSGVATYLREKNIVSQQGLSDISRRAQTVIDEAFAIAQQAPLPKREDILKYLFAS